MPEQAHVGQAVAARRLALCISCSEDTVQTLRWIYTGSPGSYRGIRLRPMYTCGQCGGVCHG